MPTPVASSSELPELTACCPYCHASAGNPCTDGARVRKRTVHQGRRAEWADQPAPTATDEEAK